MVDILKANGYKDLDINKIRLWSFPGKKEELVDACKSVAKPNNGTSTH